MGHNQESNEIIIQSFAEFYFEILFSTPVLWNMYFSKHKLKPTLDNLKHLQKRSLQVNQKPTSNFQIIA